MAQCPVCHADVPDDFGLIECGNCGSQLLAHMDGTVEHNGAQAPPANATADELQPEPQPEAEVPFEFADPPQEFEYQEDPPAPVESVPPPENEPPISTPASEPAPAMAVEPVADFLEDPPPTELAEPSPEMPVPAEEPAPMETYSPPSMTSDSADLSDIAQFGNSDASAGRDGSLRYNIMISGIDTSDVREAFRSIITDRKFLWDTEQLLRSIKDGQVRIENVGPAKAYILVESLRTLPVMVEWEQYAIHQA